MLWQWHLHVLLLLLLLVVVILLLLTHILLLVLRLIIVLGDVVCERLVSIVVGALPRLMIYFLGWEEEALRDFRWHRIDQTAMFLLPVSKPTLLVEVAEAYIN